MFKQNVESSWVSGFPGIHGFCLHSKQLTIHNQSVLCYHIHLWGAAFLRLCIEAVQSLRAGRKIVKRLLPISMRKVFLVRNRGVFFPPASLTKMKDKPMRNPNEPMRNPYDDIASEEIEKRMPPRY